jgi:hypothetical protein
MNQHEYVAGFFGVLIGFTLTELIKGVAETFKNLDRVKYYYPHGLFVILMLFTIILNFFDFYKFFSWVGVWTPLLLLRYTFPSIFVCFLCYMLFPTFNTNEKVDFREHYFKLSRTIHFLIMSMIVLIVIRNIFFIRNELFGIANVLMVLIFLVSLGGLLIKKDWAQYLFLTIAFTAVVYWTLTLRLAET